MMPDKPEFEFLRPKNFRIKTMKMGGVLSQGICFPLSILPQGSYSVGDDVTDIIGVKKYDEYPEEPIPGKKHSPLRRFLFKHELTKPLGRLIYGVKKEGKDDFPAFLEKTDETRIQCLPELFRSRKIGDRWIGREKIDGQSATYYVVRKPKLFPFMWDRYEFGVCSRNRRLPKPDNSSYWDIARRYDIENVLRLLLQDEYRGADFLAIQGEIIGPKIQGNKYHVYRNDFYCFNLVTPGGRVPCSYAEAQVGYYGLKWAPLVVYPYDLPETVEEVLAFADGESQIYPTRREGIVFRDRLNYNRSFKAVSNEFLLEHKQ